MTKFTIKYQTYDGAALQVERMGYDRRHVIGQLINCRYVYWVKSEKVQ